MQTYYTRAEYMEDVKHEGKGPSAAHRRYFGQFVTPGTIARVLGAIGKEKLTASSDPHLNDIPLRLWDQLTPQLPGSAGFSKAGDFYTLANGVCLAKEAARQWLDSQKPNK